MASTPPRAKGNPDDAEWRRWAEERLRDLSESDSITQTRVEATQRGVSNAGNVAVEAAIKGAEVEKATIAVDSNNRIARPLLDGTYWTTIVQNRGYVFERVDANGEVIERSTARNVIWNDAGGFIFQPDGDTEGAQIHITPILPVPASGKLYLEVPLLGSTPVEIWIEWRDQNGAIIDSDVLGSANPRMVASQSVTPVPSSSVIKYSILLAVPAGAGVAACLEPKVFESVGKDGMSISPGGISVDGTLEINPSLPILDAPSAPILASSVGSVSVRWDGNLTSGPAPTHLSYVVAEEGVSSSGPWTRVGQTLNKDGYVVTRPPVDSERWYRLTAYDTSNRPSLPSASASIVVQGVSIPDLSGDIGDVIDTVDGLNKIFYQAKENPPTAHANGDLWFVVDPDTSIVTEVNIWNGTIWTPYRLVADSVLVPSSVGTITLADGAITAPKVAAKSLTAEQIQAGSISVDELIPNIGASLDISINPVITDLQDGLEQQAIRFRFDSAGLHIGDPSTDDELRLSPGRIEMVQSGQVPTWWEAQTFYVERMIVDAANIANHRWENAGPGRSILRPL